ncbi:MAG TPA: thiol:disulfide interchange protein DsbA/DsbL [Burkholderiaceae bacterium]|nr:thiol:disulfide interchange protein DsbA/DsbL [Burkholderiaceae bacterium]
MTHHDASSLRRRLIITAAALPAAGLLASVAHAQAQPREGAQYTVVKPPQPTEGKGKIEVIEFFWYGCPHCYHLQPALHAWQKKVPADVVVRHVPVAFSPDREPHSRIWYTLEAMGLVEQLHMKVFDAIHKERQMLLKEDEIANFAAKNGVDRAKWLETFKSFGVATRAQAARRMVDAYRLDGTPSLAVAGRFMTSPAAAGSVEGTFTVVDYLIDQVRKGR